MFPSAPNKDNSSPFIAGRAVKVHKEYCKAAKDLDSKHHHTPENEIDPVKCALLSFGPVAGKHEVTALGLGIGCFGELSAGFNGVFTFIARSRAVSYMDRYDDKSPKEALGMFRSRIRRVWGVGSCGHFRVWGLRS